MTTRVAVAALALLVLCSFPASGQTDEERRLEALKALPYVAWTEDPVEESAHGVTVHDTDRAFDGYTLYSGRSHATLVDMRGVPVHSWRNDALKEWEHAELAVDGSLYVVLQRRGVYRLGWNGDVVWSGEAPVHHDFDVEPGGSVLAVAYDPVVIPEFGPEPVTSDRLVRLGSDGSATDVWRLSEHRLELLAWCPREALDSVSDDVPDDDWSHMNTVEIIGGNGTREGEPRGSESREPSGGLLPGNVLVCVRNLDFIGAIDLLTGAFVWGWGPGELDHPHQPTLLPNGNILVFDNGFFRGWSRVVEYDPASGEIVWEYAAPDRHGFFSRGRGGCQKLPNGNVLITESAKGRVFEVTPGGDVVWEFLNPSRQLDRRGTFYRAMRYDRAFVESLLEPGE
ncbi:MAG: aryl-sulfate sulfotransferase [Candidatus Eisenbacteria bacterium]